MMISDYFVSTFNVTPAVSLVTWSFLSQAFEDRDFRTLTSHVRSLAVIVFPAGLDLSGRIETEQYNHQDEDDWCYAHGFFDYRQKIAATRKPSRTPINGLERANQKETRQPDS